MIDRIPNYLDAEVFSRLVNIALASSKIKSLRLPHIFIRPQFHVIIVGLSGTTKSSVLSDVCHIENKVPIMSLSKANFLGTVDKTTGLFSPPIIWNCRSSILPIDEYSFSSRNPQDVDLLSSLLQLMEFPIYKKHIGYRCNNYEETDDFDSSLYCNVKDNRIEVKTRFTVFMTTMIDLKKSQSTLIEALVNRCLIIPFYPSLDDMKRKARGEKYFRYKQIKVREQVKINKKNYEFILDFVEKYTCIDVKEYLRTVGDLCRVFSVLGKHDEEIYNLVVLLRSRW